MVVIDQDGTEGTRPLPHFQSSFPNHFVKKNGSFLKTIPKQCPINRCDTVVWDSGGMIVANAVVPQGTDAQLLDAFRYNSVGEPVVLHAGQTYVVGAWYSDAMEGVNSPGTWDPAANPHFSSIGANHAIFESGSLEFPNSFNGTNPIWGPTFQYDVVPEPSTYLLMICGIAVMVLSKRKYIKPITRK